MKDENTYFIEVNWLKKNNTGTIADPLCDDTYSSNADDSTQELQHPHAVSRTSINY